MLKLLVQANL